MAASLSVSPNPAPPSTVASVSGTGFANAKTRLSLDGQGIGSNIFRPRKDGSFNVGITVSSTAKTQTLVAEQLSGTTWSEKARTSVVVQEVVTPPPVVDPPSVTYTFYDDFPGTSLDTSKWNLVTEWPDTGLSKSSDNDPSMLSVSNSQLCLRCEKPTTGLWRSAVTDTKGKFQQLYGIFEAQMSYPAGQGLWPAFWLLEGNGKTGRRPELDVIEAYPHAGSGGGVAQYAMTNHYRNADGSMGGLTTWCKPGYDLTKGPHVFALEWRPGLLIARCDGKEMGRQTANVPAVPMFIIFDHVVGSWAGLPDSTTPNPAIMRVDWVRVQK